MNFNVLINFWMLVSGHLARAISTSALRLFPLMQAPELELLAAPLVRSRASSPVRSRDVVDDEQTECSCRRAISEIVFYDASSSPVRSCDVVERLPPSGRVRLQELSYVLEGEVVVARLLFVDFRGELRQKFVAGRSQRHA